MCPNQGRQSRVLPHGTKALQASGDHQKAGGSRRQSSCLSRCLLSEEKGKARCKEEAGRSSTVGSNALKDRKVFYVQDLVREVGSEHMR
jgi:hypothetical protein